MASRFSSSIWTDSDGSAAGEVASVFMIVERLDRRRAERRAPSPSSFRMLPPALATSVLNQTVTPSYWAPWISM